MADIDLKTETPDTSLPTTGFLFGADSQAASAPSVYSTQTVATTLLGSTSLTGATITADAPVLNLSQTWNASGVTFTGLRFNAAGTSDANSAAGSLLMDLQIGGTSRFNVQKVSGGGTVLNIGNTVAIQQTGTTIAFRTTALTDTAIQASVATLSTGLILSGTSSLINFNSDLFLTRRAAANLRLGAADAAAPVAQTLSVQSVVAGTSNTAGQNFTITGSQGTGTGAGGSIIFQVAPAGSSGTAQNALATFLEATSARAFNLYNTTDVTTNFERGKIAWESNVFRIGTEKGGTGTARALEFQTDGTTRLTIGNTGGVTISRSLTISGNSGGNLGGSTGLYIGPTGAIIEFQSISSGVLCIAPGGAGDIRVQLGGTTSSFPALKRVSANLQVIAADNAGSAGLIVGNQALATTATDGFLYVPTCAGTPTGTPTTQTGTVPIVVDTTNNKLYFYSGAAWRDAGP